MAKKIAKPKNVQELLSSDYHRVQIEVMDNCINTTLSAKSLKEIIDRATEPLYLTIWEIDGIVIEDRDLPYLIQTGELKEEDLEIVDGKLVRKKSVTP